MLCWGVWTLFKGPRGTQVGREGRDYVKGSGVPFGKLSMASEKGWPGKGNMICRKTNGDLEIVRLG